MGDISINWNSQLPFVDANLSWFQERLSAGEGDGSIGSSEQTVLNSELSQIQSLEQQDLQSGMTSQESQQLWNDLAAMNSDIYSLRHNSLGTMLPQSQYGQAPQLITEQNYAYNPAVNHDPDADGDNDMVPPPYSTPYYSGTPGSPYSYFTSYANGLIPYSSSNPYPGDPTAYFGSYANGQIPYPNYTPTSGGSGYGYGYPSSAQPAGYDAELSQLEAQMTQQLQQSMQFATSFQPSPMGGIMTGLLGALTFLI